MHPVWWDIIISQSVICEKWVSIFKVKVTVTEFRFILSNMTISIICFELLISLTVYVHELECFVKRLLCCSQGQGHSEGSELQWMFARTISLIGQTWYGDASSSARVSFRNIILRCSRSSVTLTYDVTLCTINQVPVTLSIYVLYLCTQEMSSFHFQIIALKNSHFEFLPSMSRYALLLTPAACWKLQQYQLMRQDSWLRTFSLLLWTHSLEFTPTRWP